MENAPAPVALWGPRRYIIGSKFPQIQRLPGDSMARQFVYFMQGLTKSYPTRKVLDNVHLSFYPDAKIGVLAVNGSGKSTLLRLIAGPHKEHNGKAPDPLGDRG